MADVRTLDGWRTAGVERKFEEFDFTTTESEPRRLFVFAIDTSNEPARAKAAAWVRSQPPTSKEADDV